MVVSAYPPYSRLRCLPALPTARPALRRGWLLLVLLAGLGALPACTPRLVARPFGTGLNQPRGMAFDDAGNLYVAETGTRDKPAAGEKPSDINHSGRVLRITPNRQVTTVMDGLPYTYYVTTGDVGPADVVVGEDWLYVLVGEGYDDDLSRTVLRRPLHAAAEGPPDIVAHILYFAIGMSTGTEQQMGVVSSNPYAMVSSADGDALYVADGASGRILRITLDGTIRLFAELPDMPPLTGLAYGPDGRLYVAMFSLRPHAAGSGEVWAVSPDGEPTRVLQGLSMPIDVGFDAAGRMYVLEFSRARHADQPYAPSRGRLLRIAEDGTPTVLLDQLNYPTSLAFAPSGDLYIAINGAFSAAKKGAILRLPCRGLGDPNACRRESAR